MEHIGTLFSFVVLLVQISIHCECLKNDLTKLSMLDDRHMDQLAFRQQRNEGKTEYLKCVEEFCLPGDYSSSTMPKQEVDTSSSGDNITSLEVTLEFSDVDILEVSDLKHTLTMLMYMGVHWNEPRLISPKDLGKQNKVPLDLQFLEHLWLPDLDIYNVKHIKDFKVLKKLAGLWAYNGTVLFFSQSILLTIFCPMSFNWYPFEIQHCKLEIGSYSYDMENVKFSTVLHNMALEENQILDYDFKASRLKEDDIVQYWSSTGKKLLSSGFRNTSTATCTTIYSTILSDYRIICYCFVG